LINYSSIMLKCLTTFVRRATKIHA